MAEAVGFWKKMSWFASSYLSCPSKFINFGMSEAVPSLKRLRSWIQYQINNDPHPTTMMGNLHTRRWRLVSHAQDSVKECSLEFAQGLEISGRPSRSE